MAYPDVPAEDRWIFNKIELEGAKPVGMRFDPGDYCVRPVINLMGMAAGGFRRVILEKSGFIQEPVGHCVTPWTNGYREWHTFVDDECWYSEKTIDYTDGLETMIEVEPEIELPDRLRGISRYMLVEYLGDRIIDVSPRLSNEQMREDIIEDYRQFDPDYQAPPYGKWGFQPYMRTVYRDGAFYLEEIER